MKCVDGILNCLGKTAIDIYDYSVEFVETVWSGVNAELSNIKSKSRHLNVNLGKYEVYTKCLPSGTELKYLLSGN